MHSGTDPARPAGGRILLIDDELIFSAALKEILQMRGYAVETAHLQADAERKITSFDPAVALIDIKLGKANGLSLLQLLHRQSPQTLCIMMTAYAETDTAVRALQEGAYDYLIKPVDIDALLVILDRAFERVRLGIEKTQAEEALRRRNQELAELNARLKSMVEAATALAASLDQRELSSRLLQESARNLDALGGSLYRVLPDRLRLVSSLDGDHVPATIAFPLPPASIFARAIAERGPILIRDIGQEPGLQTSGWDGYRDGSIIVFPILERSGEIHSLVSLHNKRLPPFTELDIEVGLILISLAAEVLRVFRTNALLKDSEARYRFLFEKSAAGNVMIDAGWRIADINEIYLSRLGYTKQEVLGRSVFDFVPPERHEFLRQSVEPALRGLAYAEFELEIRGRDAPHTVLFPGTKPVKVRLPQGGMGVLVTLIDITERKSGETRERRREAQMFQAAKMVSLGTLVSGVAHEINNPNNFIRMSAENLQDLWSDAAGLLQGMDSLTPGLALKGIPFADARGMITGMLQGITEGSQRIERLIDTLKDFGRKELGERDESVDLNVVARSAVKMVESRIKKAACRFTCDLLEGLPRVRGSSHQLEQVVINLLNNALEALTAPEQAVTVSTEWDKPCNTISVTVADEGMGINSEDLDRITDPFFTTKRDTGGTGLGLSVSYQIAKNHGGEIAFLSKTGRGTTARLTLPTGGACSG